MKECLGANVAIKPIAVKQLAPNLYEMKCPQFTHPKKQALCVTTTCIGVTTGTVALL